jgi:DNA-directed RNA polymerase sigma subunit (sigma70/sigma32)
MNEGGKAWDMSSAEKLRANMSADEVAALKLKGQVKPASLTLDEVGVLFLVTRERIREIERNAGSKGGQT